MFTYVYIWNHTISFSFNAYYKQRIFTSFNLANTSTLHLIQIKTSNKNVHKYKLARVSWWACNRTMRNQATKTTRQKVGWQKWKWNNNMVLFTKIHILQVASCPVTLEIRKWVFPKSTSVLLEFASSTSNVCCKSSYVYSRRPIDNTFLMQLKKIKLTSLISTSLISSKLFVWSNFHKKKNVM